MSPGPGGFAEDLAKGPNRCKVWGDAVAFFTSVGSFGRAEALLQEIARVSPAPQCASVMGSELHEIQGNSDAFKFLFPIS